MAATTTAAGATPRRRRRYSVLTRRDKIVLGLAIGIPATIHIALVWIPTISSIVLSFTAWNGIGGIQNIKWVGLQNYINVFTTYPPFWPALTHNLVWLLTFLFIATPIGILFAVLLDKNIRGTRFYQSAIYLPVVLSLAIVGFIWQLQYAPDQGSSTMCSGGPGPGSRSPGSATRRSTSRPSSSRPAGDTSATSWCCTWPD
jgi:ABC-type sugar transport system permease subunit